MGPHTRNGDPNRLTHDLALRLIDAAPSLICSRLLADYGNYLSKGAYGATQHIAAVKTHREIYPLELEYIASQIAMEQRANPHFNLSLETPYMNAVELAARAIEGITAAQLAWEISQAVQRDRNWRSGVKALIFQGDWMGLACQIIKDRVQLKTLPAGNGMIWEGEVGAWEDALERCATEWFEKCLVKPSGIMWALPRLEKWEMALGRQRENVQ
ncbi:uncharacterized protein K452DRAFT_296986 [Aplosporella prunicola CBS 121167]|uniref:Uncharacterized protein n=1 Tax=Aplosporella prunicola CBS 121167 TaxID=1176127 RepID=A0A6A6BHX2_9PEZI|nr:uncharacterized protein K452DRAFT_296986 [Aplosporella prunicola CBS 121167]KAF2143208.1 hypothetical protein K452DRAFT_296986 [Aplosporella prunicola CBS 121167]